MKQSFWCKNKFWVTAPSVIYPGIGFIYNVLYRANIFEHKVAFDLNGAEMVFQRANILF